MAVLRSTQLPFAGPDTPYRLTPYRLGNKAFAEACESVCRSEVSLASAMRNFDTYGKTFADAIAEVHSAGQVQAGSIRSATAPGLRRQ
jgi:hypothetical protein